MIPTQVFTFKINSRKLSCSSSLAEFGWSPGSLGSNEKKGPAPRLRNETANEIRPFH